MEQVVWIPLAVGPEAQEKLAQLGRWCAEVSKQRDVWIREIREVSSLGIEFKR